MTLWPWNRLAVAAFLGFMLGFAPDGDTAAIALVLLLLHMGDVAQGVRP